MGRLVFDDATQNGLRQRMTRGFPGTPQQRNGQRFADAKEADDHIRSSHQRPELRIGVHDQVVRVVLDLRAAAKLHGQARAKFDVHQLVKRKAGRHGNQIRAAHGTPSALVA